MDKKFQIIGKLEDGTDILGLDFNAEVKVLADDEIEMIGSTDDVDRYQETIDINGWDLKNYKKNPVILPAHDYTQPAIGKATKIQVKDGKLTFRIKFPPEGDYPLADIYRKLYKGGFMSASSVGFIAKEWEDGEKEKSPVRNYKKVELLELSLVSVPANPNALMTSKSIINAVRKGVLSGADIKTLETYAKQAFSDVDKNIFKKDSQDETSDEETDENKEESKNKIHDDGSEQSNSEAGDIGENKDYKMIYKELSEIKGLILMLDARLKQSERQKHYLEVEDLGVSQTVPSSGFEFIEAAKSAFTKK